MGITKQLTTALGLILTLLLPFSTWASMYTTYQARIIKPDGTPLESATVNFRFTILDPLGSCILYTENFNTINMAGSGGLVNFSLGSGIKTFPVSGSVNFSDVFNNDGTAFSCAAGGPPAYISAANDLRKIVMQFQDGTGWQTLPAMSINHVPYAMYAKNSASATTAINSTQLNGKTDLDFVQLSAIPTCSASQALQFNGASFGCVSAGGGSGGSISVSGTAPIMVTGAASSPQISISVASMSSDGYLTAADYAEFKAKLSTSSTQIINTLGFAPVSAAAVATQITAQISAAAAVSNTVSTLVLRDLAGNIWANDVYSNSAKTNYVDIFKPGTAFSIRLQAPVSLAANYNLIFPDTDGVGGQVLTTDGSGNLSWANVASATTTTLNGSSSATQFFANAAAGTTPAFVTANGVHTLNIPYASAGSVTAGLISNSDYQNFSNKMNATSGAVISALGYTPASTTALSSFLQISNNLTDLASATIARMSLGLGLLATKSQIDLSSTDVSGTLALTHLSDSGVVSNTYTKVSVDTKGRVTSGTQLNASDVAAALGYTPAVSGAMSSQWNTSGTTINYLNGNVGLGTSNPASVLHIEKTDNSAVRITRNGETLNALLGDLGSTNHGQLNLYNASGTLGVLLTSGSGDSYFNGGGNVGVGTANPNASVDVVKSGTGSYTGFKSNISSTAGNATGVDVLASGSNYSTGVLVEVESNGAAVGVDIYAAVNSVSGSYVRGIDVGIDDSLVAGSGLRLFASTVTTKASKAIEISSGFNSGYAIYANTDGKSYFKGNVGIGTTTPVTKLDVSGAIRISMDSASCAVSYAGALRYNGSSVEYCNGTTWSAFGVAGSGITSINGSTSGTQSFANGITGTAPAFVTANGMHTLNIPLASAGSVAAGLISNSDYTTFMNKMSATSAAVVSALGYTPASSTALANYLVKTNNLSDLSSTATARSNLGLGGFATISSLDLGSASATGTLAAGRLPAFNGDVTSVSGSASLTVDGLQGRSVLSTAPTSGQALAYNGSAWAPASMVSSQWSTSGTSINYMSGNVGIGSTAPEGRLEVNGYVGGNYAASSSSSYYPFNSSGQGTAFIEITNNQTGYGSGGSYLGLKTNAMSGTPYQRAYIGVVANMGASNYTPRIVIGHQTGATSYQERMSIDTSGNVGIGTTSPTSNLHINTGISTVNYTGLKLQNAFKTWTIGNNVPNSYNNIFSIFDGTTSRLWISDTGNVGIGTTAPAATLDVSGTIKISGGSAGSGKVLTSDVSGNASWQAPTGDNLGNHTATQNINLGNYKLVGQGGSEGITISSAGNIRLGSVGGSTGITTGPATSTSGSSWASIAAGFDATATSITTFAFGSSVHATNWYAFATGNENTAAGKASAVFGQKMTVNADYSVGIGLSSTTSYTMTTPSTMAIMGGKVGIGITAPSEVLEVSGSVKATGFITSSDRRLKENVQTSKGLDFILNLRGVSYNWKHDGRKEYGLIAQEVEQILPELVVTDQISGMKGVRYQSLVSPLIEATKELYHRCEDQKKSVNAELEHLKNKNERLEEQVGELREKLEEIEKYLKLSKKLKKRATASE